MGAAFLITLREAIEAACIVAAVAGSLARLGRRESLRSLWLGVGAALLSSILLVATGSIFGWQLQEVYEGLTEQLTEGILMAVSAVFITWAVFYLHAVMSKPKYTLGLVEKAHEKGERGIFFLVFSAVFREGIEVAIFLSTVYLTAKPVSVLTGSLAGVLAGVLVSLAFFSASYNLPVKYAFKGTSILLILFAAGMVARAAHEFSEIFRLDGIGKVTLSFLPPPGQLHADIFRSLFGLGRSMDAAQLIPYCLYALVMAWFVSFRKAAKPSPDCDC